MRANSLRWSFVLGIGLCCGCAGSTLEPQNVEEKPKEPEKPKIFQLDDPIDISLEELLAQPREKLASQADELAERIRIQETRHRQGEMAYNLLPSWHMPLAIPIFQKANYSAKLGLSVPSYLHGDKDNDVALHLARYGDGEAAMKLADATNRTLREQIEQQRYDKNYPLEWVRLVAMHLHVAQVRLATGDEEGGRLLVGLHRQLQTVLDAKARTGLLGAALLPRGRGAFAGAADAWRKAKNPELASQADAIVAAWGKAPSWSIPALTSSTKKAEIARALNAKGRLHALAAASSARAFDLLSLPFPDENVDSVITCFNSADELAEVLIVYKSPVFMLFPRPEQLGQVVEDWDLGGKDVPASGSVSRRSYALDDVEIEIATVADHTAFGALVRVGSSARLKKHVALERELGPIHLDQSFEQNRLRFSPSRKGTKLMVDDPGELKKVGIILGELTPSEATLESDPDARVVSRFSLRAAPGRHGFPPLGRLALPLWEMGGAARIETAEGKEAYAFVLVWEDEKTRFTLTLPHGKREDARLDVTDRTSAHDLPARAAEAAARDRADRRRRIESKRPWSRIKREREHLRLGMTENEVLKAFPGGEGITRRSIPGGLGVVVESVPEKSPGYVPRELFVRFGADKVVAEVRIRYASPPGASDGASKLSAEVRAAYGAPRELAGSWTGAWSDYPGRAPAPTLYRWEDDVTIMTCQRDSEGVELTLLDRPLDKEDGVNLGAFQCVSAGPKNCTLGMMRADLLKVWKDSKPTFQDNILIVTPPAESRYSQIQVYFRDAGAPARRIVALHAQKWEKDPGEEKLEEAVQIAWDQEKTGFGFYRRMDLTTKGNLQSLTSHDDVRRVCIFWQATQNGPRLYTEWTALKAAKK